MRHTTLLAVASLIFACDSVEDNARRLGISREDARHISHDLRAEKHAHAIYQFERAPNQGPIIVHTDIGSFVVERNGEKWEFTEVLIH
jgi:hypothetical protein